MLTHIRKDIKEPHLENNKRPINKSTLPITNMDIKRPMLDMPTMNLRMTKET